MGFRSQFLDRLQALPQREPFRFPPEALPRDHKPAAVLIPLWPAGEDGVQVVFTRRPRTLSSHPGQVSFPGGRVDPEDASSEAAALREAHEELAIVPEQVTVLGRLDDAWSIAGHHVVPYVGWLDQCPEMTPNQHEVEEILVADVQTLMGAGAACEHEHEFRGITRRTRAFRWPQGYVWGLTADLFYELLLWVRQEPSDRGRQRLEFLEYTQQD